MFIALNLLAFVPKKPFRRTTMRLYRKNLSLFSALGIEAVSPDLEKQGFLAVVFVNREYSRKPDRRERP
jgi:hypothetical protein